MSCVGEIIRDDNLGKDSALFFVFAHCPDCGLERFVDRESLKKQIVPGRCRRCATNSDEFRNNISVKMVGRKFRLGKRWGSNSRARGSLAQKKRYINPHEREKARERMLGTQYALGHQLSPQQRLTASQNLKLLWQDSEFVRRQMEARNVTPNKSELKLTSILRELNLPYKFVGDGQVILCGKCPDYINVDGQKKIIELFGDYWHDIEIVGHSIEEEIRQRIDFFSQLGFKTLVILDSELRNVESVKKRIIAFNGE